MYDFAHFLLDSKLDMSPDPLLEPKKSRFLTDGGYIENYQEDVKKCEPLKKTLVFSSEYECGNMGAVFIRLPNIPGQ